MTRIIGWSLVAIYTLALPHVNAVHKTIERQWSTNIAAKIPAALIVLMGLVYIVSVIILKKGGKSLAWLLACTMITLALVVVEPNPNKHIHIPEYIVMAWILFEVLSADYHGKGLFVLIFICATLLGIVDELQQGIHPERFFGWQDMVINATASLIGIFSLAGLRKRPAGDWTWIHGICKPKTSFVVVLFGAAGAVVTCAYLLDLQTSRTFWEAYPSWLVVWNSLFLAVGLAVIFSPVNFYTTDCSIFAPGSDSIHYARTAGLWMFCPLIILLVIHGLVLMVAASGLPFR